MCVEHASVVARQHPTVLIGAGDELLAVPALGGDPRAITLIGADGQPHTDDGAQVPPVFRRP